MKFKFRRAFLLLTLSLFASAPASLLAIALERACAGQCRLASANGFWWSGQGRLFLRPTPETGWVALGNLSWQLSPGGQAGELLALAAVLNQGEIRFGLGTDGARFSADLLSLPASGVLAHPAWRLPAAGWQGRLIAHQVHLRADWKGKLSGNGELAWHEGSSSLLENLPLGTITLKFSIAPGTGLYGNFAGGLPDQFNVQGQFSNLEHNGRLDASVLLTDPSHAKLEKYLRASGARVTGENKQFELAFRW